MIPNYGTLLVVIVIYTCSSGSDSFSADSSSISIVFDGAANGDCDITAHRQECSYSHTAVMQLSK